MKKEREPAKRNVDMSGKESNTSASHRRVNFDFLLPTEMRKRKQEDELTLEKLNQSAQKTLREYLSTNDGLIEQLVGRDRPHLLKFFRQHVKQLCTAPNEPNGTMPIDYNYCMSEISKFWEGVCATYPNADSANRIFIVFNNTLELILNIRSFNFNTAPSLDYQPLIPAEVMTYIREIPIITAVRCCLFGSTQYKFRCDNPNTRNPVWYLKGDTNAYQHHIGRALWQEKPYSSKTFDKLYNLLQQDNSMALILSETLLKEHEMTQSIIEHNDEIFSQHIFIRSNQSADFILPFCLLENNSALEPNSINQLYNECHKLLTEHLDTYTTTILRSNYQFWKGALCSAESTENDFKKSLCQLNDAFYHLESYILHRLQISNGDKIPSEVSDGLKI